MAKSDSIWEMAILQVLESHDGLATLSDLYNEVPVYIKKSNSKDINHALRAYLYRLKTKKQKIKQVGLASYALIDKELEEGIFEKIEQYPEETKFELLEKIPKEQMHGYAEGMLIELGKVRGMQTYTPDKKVKFNGVSLESIIDIHEVPCFTYETVISQSKNIDVIWFIDGYPIATFDVENSTDFTKGFLRAYQLKAFKCKFYFVADETKESLYNKKLEYQPFATIKSDYNFLSYSKLFDEYRDAINYSRSLKKAGIKI